MTIPTDITAHPHNCIVCSKQFFCTEENCDEEQMICEDCSEQLDDDYLDDFEEEEEEEE